MVIVHGIVIPVLTKIQVTVQCQQAAVVCAWYRSVTSVASHLNNAGAKNANRGISKMLSQSMARFVILILFLLWHVPLGMRSAKRRHQSPEWPVLSHVNYFIQREVIGFQVLLDSLHPSSTWASWWSPPVLQFLIGSIFSLANDCGCISASSN